MLTSCASLKPLNFIGNKPVASASPQEKPVKFIDDIAVQASNANNDADNKTPVTSPAKKEVKLTDDVIAYRSSNENVSSLQLKYAALLNTDPVQLQNKALLENIDDWYGTRYRLGGSTKSGIDCSAFVCAIYAGAFGISLPRTAREQYNVTKHISRTELKEGDLLFFNTRGGVSHVGIYLQNNKFVHASTNKGVTISDIFEPYYNQHFISAGRVKNRQEPVASR